MSLLSIKIEDGIAHVAMKNGSTNPISRQLINELDSCLSELESPECKGVILYGGSKFFSMGLNLPELMDLNREEMSVFFKSFNAVLYRIYALPKPTMCLLEGHCIAGGAVLAMMTDYRYAVEGEQQFGFNEIKLGLSIPYLASRALQSATNPTYAKHLLYTGGFQPFSEAYEYGILDQLRPEENLRTEALIAMRQLTEFNPQAFWVMKKSRIENNLELYRQHNDAKIDEFLELWFQAATQNKLTETAKLFKN